MLRETFTSSVLTMSRGCSIALQRQCSKANRDVVDPSSPHVDAITEPHEIFLLRLQVRQLARSREFAEIA